MAEEKKYTILIGAGGTGGHIFPAIALAKKFKSDGHKVVIVGTGNALEKKIFAQYDIETVFFKNRFKDTSRLKKYLAALTRPDRELRRYVAELSPQLILGMGGYASFDLCKTAFYLQTIERDFPGNIIMPYVAIHEQNAKAGRANRYIAATQARGIIEGLPGGFDWKTNFLKLSTDDHVFLGNPVRDDILNINRIVRSFPDKSKKPRIFIMGGSQGARSINMIAPKAISLLMADLPVEVMHDSGEKDFEAVNDQYLELGIDAKITRFNPNIEKAYEWADLLISRAGAMTVSEASAIGLPSILIPFPHAMDNHQWFNAQFIAKKGGAEVILDKDLKLEILVKTIKKIFLQEGILSEMAEATYDETFVNATQNIAQFCYKMIEQPPLKDVGDGGLYE
ncbi:MAG TPA: UDP-N-acetylglucosamine--N-acetylmuramyl-(pentapeptide) pyrophosphoryl-undecaprenol N-acetylglucosamine transferase [Gammaproteobacteria bacterium]|jgi:UDP-N-acetylglucosamine--N-acetylmuramyl-(pentapeptide) pyrophosphoryl-undecaprenol N-acetylglucosamine transferase|nr:UDP-N-acetylglucosamine--N-acetylmuramyl-(pentapeptide) pyrophosphoryl-undecaprenol N-acetylglucosamine transferase [Gammaproteobacteria bacterium]HIK76660.1 UDP-N-acetylglucosamine--N-acetylmuramyl-(pentapeptide) pyrophosphoryl-undecaprenol N-acetylglucosamine transferase [Gammaproteobacteria bacterium]